MARVRCLLARVLAAVALIIPAPAWAQSISISTAGRNPRTTVERGDCLTVAAGQSAAYECGDLRIDHPLPATITMNKARTPTLLYNSRHAATHRLARRGCHLRRRPAGTAPGHGYDSERLSDHEDVHLESRL